MIRNYTAIPTVQPKASFNAEEDAKKLRAAMKGIGTDEGTVVQVLTSCSNEQRQELKTAFKKFLGRDLMDDLRYELVGKLQNLVEALMAKPNELAAILINLAFEGIGSDTNAITEILVTRTPEQLKELVEVYEKLYNRPLVEHLVSETSGEYSQLLTYIITGKRNAAGATDKEKAKVSAQELFKAGEGNLGSQTEVFTKIFTQESYDQLNLIFEEYRIIAGRTIEQALNSELSILIGNYRSALLAIVETAKNPLVYFAKQLRDALDRLIVDDTTLIRIIVSRSEDDLGNIKQQYEIITERTLSTDVNKKTSGYYQKALLALIGKP